MNNASELALKIVAFAVLIHICLISSGCAIRMPARDVELTELVSEVEKRAYIVQRFRASFIKTKHSRLFEKDLKVEGRLIFRKPDQFSLVTSGDISVKVVSNGKIVSLIHDGKDEEIYRLQGQRDTARFSDPLMLLVDSIGKGAFHKFAVNEKLLDTGETMIEIDPGNVTSFERVNRALIWFDSSGQFKKIRIEFENGNWDETVFLNWSILSEDSPSIKELDQDIDSLLVRAKEQYNEVTGRTASNGADSEWSAYPSELPGENSLPFGKSEQPGWHMEVGHWTKSKTVRP